MKQVVVVKTKTFENLDKPLMYYVDFLHEKYVQEGYEGLIIRNSESCYVLNYRSKDLQKYKQFIDEEYEIVSGKEATGEDAGTVIFECKTPGDIIFSVRPRGSRELRKYMLQNLKNYIGKKLTVRYQNLSERNVPRFPVGITVRDYE
jgi:DNA ligase-1